LNNPRGRVIDPAREALALERIPEFLIGDDPLRGLGVQCRVLDVIADARIYGASKAACCELLDVSTKTVERWAKRRQRLCDALSEAGL